MVVNHASMREVLLCRSQKVDVVSTDDVLQRLKSAWWLLGAALNGRASINSAVDRLGTDQDIYRLYEP